ATSKTWSLVIDGVTNVFDFDGYTSAEAYFWKSYLAFRFSRVHNATIRTELPSIKRMDNSELLQTLSCPPGKFSLHWEKLRAKNFPDKVYTLVKNVLRMMAEYGVGGWDTSHSSFIERHLPTPAADKFRTIRTGDDFLSAREEALVIKYIDEVSQQ